MKKPISLPILILTTVFSCVTCQTTFGNIPPSERQFRVAYEWNTIDFAFGSDQLRSNAIFSGEYIPQNNIISDVKGYGKRLYLSLPRMLPGVPATLGYIIQPENNGRTDPEVEAFPSWEMNMRGNCSALQFVQGIAIDKEGILWAVDSGRSETLVQGYYKKKRNYHYYLLIFNYIISGPPRFSCPPKIVLLDLKFGGRLVHRYEFPEEVASPGTNYLNKIVVDDAFGGYAYITDNSGVDPGIVVFSRRLNRSWKVRENNSMRAAINAVNFSVNGTELNFSIHIDGIALGPYLNRNLGLGITNPGTGVTANDNFERNVYYSPLSSYHLYALPASLLRDPEFAARATPREILERVIDLGLKVSQTDGMIMDNHGILYFSLLQQHAIAQWDSYKPFTVENQNIIARDETYIQWTDGMGFDEEGHLYAVMNRLHNFVAGRLNPNEINFRILKSTTGTMSYVYTDDVANNVGPVLADSGIYSNDRGFINNNNEGFINDNGIGGGISSTTPFFSSLGSGRGYFNSASHHRSYLTGTVIVILIIQLCLSKFV